MIELFRICVPFIICKGLIEYLLSLGERFIQHIIPLSTEKGQCGWQNEIIGFSFIFLNLFPVLAHVCECVEFSVTHCCTSAPSSKSLLLGGATYCGVKALFCVWCNL